MRIRFTIRDLLWLTAVVALAVGWWMDHRRIVASYSAITINPLMVIQVEGGSPKPNNPISGRYLVEPGGMLNLGPAYGKVKVAGLTCSETETAIIKQLSKKALTPGVAVRIVDH